MATAAETSPSNELILQQLRDGTARFELVDNSSTPIPANPIRGLFARISSTHWNSSGGVSPALKKVERYSVHRIAGDGRCMFRALARGMAVNKGLSLTLHQERDDADELRLAVREVICESEEERRKYEEALIAITVDESLKRYCQRIARPDFWGGESELLVLSKLCHQLIIVYIPEHEHSRGSFGAGFIPIAEYGAEFRTAKKNAKPRNPVRLLYSGSNHYDLLM